MHFIRLLSATGILIGCATVSPTTMTSPTDSLRREVESIYQRPIRLAVVSTLSDFQYAVSHVDPDGTPVIQLNARANDAEADIAHELWHLKLTAEGVPKREWRYFTSGPTRMSQRFLEQCDAMLLDAILHSLFYQDIRHRGLDPSRVDRDAIRKLLGGKLDSAETYPLLPLTWVSYALTLDDDELLHQLRAWYLANNAERALATGEAMVSDIRASELKTSEQIIATYVSALNSLLGGRGKFRVGAWSDERVGAITRRVVLIEQVE